MSKAEERRLRMTYGLPVAVVGAPVMLGIALGWLPVGFFYPVYAVAMVLGLWLRWRIRGPRIPKREATQNWLDKPPYQPEMPTRFGRAWWRN